MRIQKKSSIHSKQSCLIPKQVLLLCILHTDVWTMRTCKFYWPKSPWWLSLHLFFLFEVFLLFYLVVFFLRPLLGQRYRCVRNRRVCILRLPNAISLTTGFSTCACACPWKCVRGRVCACVCVRHKGKKLTPPVCVCAGSEKTRVCPRLQLQWTNSPLFACSCKCFSGLHNEPLDPSCFPDQWLSRANLRLKREPKKKKKRMKKQKKCKVRKQLRESGEFKQALWDKQTNTRRQKMDGKFIIGQNTADEKQLAQFSDRKPQRHPAAPFRLSHLNKSEGDIC